jgi:CDP-diglyceride synthetase
MYTDYKVLPMAPKIFKGLSWVGITLGIISALVIFSGLGAPETPRWMGLVTPILGAVYFFVFSVVAEVVKLLLDMNSRIK